ncbi:MAG: hypothetical protein MJY44_04445 [Bacteroidales bacterium]|nr:hypothetical protein [Bacteroidales bacterium]
MKNFVKLGLYALLLSACVSLEPAADVPERDDSELLNPDDTVLYFTVMEYPDDYDWHLDSAASYVRPTLVLYRDFRPLLSVDVSAENEVSADFDRHHIINGHLYTEYSAGGRTVIKKDGNLLFAYDGEEKLRTILLQGKDLVTLGATRGREGLSLRRNGKVIYSSETGVPTSDLYTDSGDLCFSYRTTVSGQPTDWLFCRDTSVIVGTGSSETICDIRKVDGIVNRIVCRSGKYYMDSGNLEVQLFPKYKISECYFCNAAGRLAVVCRARTKSILFPTDKFLIWEGGRTLLDKIMEQEYVYDGPSGFVVVDFYNNNHISYTVNGVEKLLDADCHFFGRDCASLVGDKIYIAVTPRDSNISPYVFCAGSRQNVATRGAITRLEVVTCPSL